MEHVEWFALVLFSDEFKPINERVVHTFVYTEARDADTAVGESPLFGGEQVAAGTEEADVVSNRSQQACESFG